MLEIKNLSVKQKGIPVLENISFRLRPHRFTALLGLNGTGKSTLISCINQQLPYVGSIAFSDRDLTFMNPKERAMHLAVLPQLLTSPPYTVEELVAFGRHPYLDFTGRLRDTDKKAIEDCLELTGANAFRLKRADQSSGGERQLAYLSMILAQDARVLILDEPTTFMDMERELQFFELITDVKTKRKKTLLVAMHNLNLAVRYADDILILDDQQIRFFGDTQECLSQQIIEQVFHVTAHSTTDGRIFFEP